MSGRPGCASCSGTGFSRSSSGPCGCVFVTCRACAGQGPLAPCDACFGARRLDRRKPWEVFHIDRQEAQHRAALAAIETGAPIRACSGGCGRMTTSERLCPTCDRAEHDALASESKGRAPRYVPPQRREVERPRAAEVPRRDGGCEVPVARTIGKGAGDAVCAPENAGGGVGVRPAANVGRVERDPVETRVERDDLEVARAELAFLQHEGCQVIRRGGRKVRAA